MKFSSYASLLDIINRYSETLTQQGASEIESCIIKYCLPYHGFYEALEEKRRTRKTTDKALELLAKLPAKTVVNLLEQFEWLVGEGRVKSSVSRTNRATLKKMVDWCRKNGCWETEEAEYKLARTPPLRRTRISLSGEYRTDRFRTTNKKKKRDYGLKESLVNSKLQKEIENWVIFFTEKFSTLRQSNPWSAVTLRISKKSLYLIFGWLNEQKGIEAEKLSFDVLFPETSRVSLESANNAKVVKNSRKLIVEFMNWLEGERCIAPSTIHNYVGVILNIAKYCYSDVTDYPRIQAYRDISIITEIRVLLSQLNKQIKVCPAVRNPTLPQPEYPDLFDIIEQLKAYCAPITYGGNKRKPREIAKSFQRYLIVSMLTYIPPRRQSVIRHLQVGKTLRKIDGSWSITLWEPGSYKEFDIYGAVTIPTPDFLSSEIDRWLSEYRAAFDANHDFVFTTESGKPFDASVFSMFFGAAIRLGSGQRFYCSPHEMRSIIVGYMIDNGATDATMESLALAMGHSRRVQQRIYDKRSKDKKLKPALDAINEFSSKLKL